MRDTTSSTRRLAIGILLAALVLCACGFGVASWLVGGVMYRLWIEVAYNETEAIGYVIESGSGDCISVIDMRRAGRHKRSSWLPGPDPLWDAERRDLRALEEQGESRDGEE